MSSLKFESIPRFSFIAEWEIGKAMFSESETLKTETKTLEGLSDVEWHLECDPNESREDSNFVCFYLIIETSTKINYTIFCKVNDYKAETPAERWNEGWFAPPRPIPPRPRSFCICKSIGEAPWCRSNSGAWPASALGLLSHSAPNLVPQCISLKKAEMVRKNRCRSCFLFWPQK